MSYNCSKCYKTFSSKCSFWGHNNRCKSIDNENFFFDNSEDINEANLNIFEENNHYELQNESDDNQDIEHNNRGDFGFEVETKYYEYQKKFFKKLDLGASNHVKTLSGVYAKGDKEIYIKLLDYIVNCHGISDSDANELLLCIKEISRKNGNEIPLPAKYQTLVDVLLKPIADMKATVELRKILFPTELMGSLASKLRPAKTIVLNIMEIISSMLIDKDIVGDDFEEFSFKFKFQYNDNGTRIFSDIASAEWFRQAEISVINECGKEVFLLGL
jgi:hypothetical protein